MNSVSIVFPKLKADQNVVSQPNWVQPGPGVNAKAKNAYQDNVPALVGNTTLFWRETIDMSSFVVQDKTFFPMDIRVADPGLLICGPDAIDWNNQASVQVLDLISNIPLDDDVIVKFVDLNIYPGMPSSPIDMQFILYGRYQAYSNNISSSFPGAMNMIKSATFGAGLPTASDKLYCIRIVRSSAGPGLPTPLATIELPATSYEIVGEATEEEELARIYRLRQSYEQKQGSQ